MLCDALLVDQISRSDTYPYVDIREDDVSMGHEASVSKVSDDQLFYLMSRGMEQDEAMAMIVRGFVEPIAKELPMEYALELNRLIELQMEEPSADVGSPRWRPRPQIQAPERRKHVTVTESRSVATELERRATSTRPVAWRPPADGP